jgi:hypothetical protein
MVCQHGDAASISLGVSPDSGRHPMKLGPESLMYVDVARLV